MRKIDTRNFQRATRGTPREVNRRIILNLVREKQPVSRADLARTMGVARGTITSLVSELIEERQLCEGGTANAPRGRKPTLLHIRTHDRFALGVDVRLSQTHLLLADFGGEESARERFRTPLDPSELVDALAERVARLLDTHVNGGRCEGLGLVVPAMVDRTTGRVLNAPTLGWRDVDLRSALEEAVDLPVHIERDAVACALAKIWAGDSSDDDLTSFVYATVSDGVGAGLVVNGRVVRGYQYTAGEFGHIPLSVDGPLCSCGARGCWEAYASNPATIARYLGQELTSREAHARVRESGLTVPDLIARAREGDTLARGAIDTTARYLGLGLASLINGLNPARIILGGEIAGGWDLIEPIVREVVAGRTLTRSAAATPIRAEPSHGETRLQGATALVTAPVFAAPEIG